MLISSQFDNWKGALHLCLKLAEILTSLLRSGISTSGFCRVDLALIRRISHGDFKCGEPLDKTTTSLCNLSTVCILALFLTYGQHIPLGGRAGVS